MPTAHRVPHRLLVLLACAFAAGAEAAEPSPAPAAAPAAAPTRAAPAVPQAPALAGVRAQHILVAFRGLSRVPAGVTRTKEEARRRALEALARAQAGEDFTALVREYTDEPGGAARGGDLGVIEPGSLVVELDRVVHTLAPGDVCPQLVETVFGFHVVKRLEPIPLVELRHILVAWQGAPRASAKIKRTKEEAKIRAADLYVQLSQGASFEELARTASDDPATAERGGALGPVRHGVTVSAFEQAALALDPGGLKVVETPFGYHVLQRVK